MPAVAASAPDALSSDMQLVRRALAREPDAFRTIIKTHNQRLYRIARGVVRNDAEAEDIVQEAYVSAFAHLDTLSRRCHAGDLAFAHRHQRGAGPPAQEAAAQPWRCRTTRQAEIIRFPLNAD